ncbi:MAG TPA: transcription elongation factor NusA, partial [Planctomycetota bacterium]|nr:transcription elongation factor NusA [Planctomycetota bacterium]
EIADVQMDEAQKRATVYVLKDQLSQAIGKGGRNVRLASKLAAWEIDIYELGGDTSAPPASQTAAEGEAKAGPAAPAAAPEAAPAPEAAQAPTEEKKNEG